MEDCEDGVTLLLINGKAYKNMKKKSYVVENIEYESNRDKYLKYMYEISEDEWLAMHTDQDGLCPICCKQLPVGKQTNVDHDHETGKVRGLLCGKCNKGLGFFNDNEATVANAAKYLWKYR